MEKRKPKLVIIHSFPTNSQILAGFYDFLADYFDILPIDLPGFVDYKKPLDDISLQNYAECVKTEVKKRKIKNYWVGGISFGFVVANLAATEENCRGVIAIEPYLNRHSLRMPRIKIFYLKQFLRLIRIIGFFERIWENKYFHEKFITDTSAKMSGKISMIIKKIDARTFFRTAEILVTADHDSCVFLKKPYVLIMNPRDTTIKTKYILRRFKKDVDNFLFVRTTASHFPTEITKKYFKEHIAVSEIRKILNFIDSC